MVAPFADNDDDDESVITRVELNSISLENRINKHQQATSDSAP